MDAIQLGNTAAWLDLLYGKCEPSDGVLIVVAAERNRLAAVHTPGSGADLVAAAKDMHSFPGCYLKINLMDYERMQKRSRKTRKPVVGCYQEVKTIVSIHLDVDAGKSEKYCGRGQALWALDQMPLKPTLVINSNGTIGGFHAYWVLEQPYRIPNDSKRDRIQKIANRWQERLKELCGGMLDSTSNLDRVLRVVGVPRTDGGTVGLEYYEPSRLYQLGDF